MKILLYEEYCHRMHGNQKYIKLLSEYMPNEIMIVTSQKSILYNNLTGNVKFLKSNVSIFKAVELYKIIKSYNADFVMVNNERSLLTAFIPSMLLNKKVIWYVKNMYKNFIFDLVGLLISHKVFFIEKELIQNKFYFFNCCFNKKKKILKIGVDGDGFLEINKNKNTLKTNVLMLSTISENKGVRVAVKAMKIADKNNKFIHLKIVGSIPKGGNFFYKEMLSEINLLKNCKIEILPWEKDINSLFRWSDVYILPSYKEGVPRSLVEAMLSGKPAIATRIGGIPSLIEHNKTGILIESGDYIALYRNMEKLMTNGVVYNSISSYAKKHAQKNHLFEAHIANLIKLLS